MSSPQHTSIRFKLALFASLLVAFVVLSFSYYMRIGQKKAIVEQLQSKREEAVQNLAHVVYRAYITHDDLTVTNYVSDLTLETMAYAMVMNPKGEVWVHSDPTQMKKTLSDPATQAALQHRTSQIALTQNIKDAQGNALLDVSVPIIEGINPTNHIGIARIGFDKKMQDAILAKALKDVDKRILGSSILALLLGLFGSFVLATFMTRPIGTLIEGAKKIGEGKLDHRIQVNTNDELRNLADEFNLMATKLGELDEMKRDFVSNVTHELRSPLTSIRGYLDLLLQNVAGSLTDLQKDYLSIIKNSSVRLSRFIDNLLDVAKIEAHKLKLSPEAADMFQTAHEMEVLFKPQLDEKKLRFLNKVPPQLPPVFVDKDKFAEVLINLTSNAIKFTPEEGQIQLSTVEGPNYVEVRIQDSGVGIPEAMIGKLFSKFEQVKSTQGLARSQKGTGLGLAIVKGIIEAHGGKIWITSPAENGKGTIFHFTVPKLTEELKRRHALHGN